MVKCLIQMFDPILLLLMEEILHLLRLVVSSIIYRVLAPSQVVQDFFHQQYQHLILMNMIYTVLLYIYIYLSHYLYTYLYMYPNTQWGWSIFLHLTP